MTHDCPGHNFPCLARKCYIPNIGWASCKDVRDDIRRYGVIFLGFQTPQHYILREFVQRVDSPFLTAPENVACCFAGNGTGWAHGADRLIPLIIEVKIS